MLSSQWRQHPSTPNMHFICQKNRKKLCLPLSAFSTSTNQHPEVMASHKFATFNLHIPRLPQGGSGTHPRSGCPSRRCHHQAHWPWRACHATSHVCPTAWETHRHSQIKNMQVLKLPFQASFETIFWVFHHKTMRSMYLFFLQKFIFLPHHE